MRAILSKHMLLATNFQIQFTAFQNNRHVHVLQVIRPVYLAYGSDRIGLPCCPTHFVHTIFKPKHLAVLFSPSKHTHKHLLCTHSRHSLFESIDLFVHCPVVKRIYYNISTKNASKSKTIFPNEHTVFYTDYTVCSIVIRSHAMRCLHCFITLFVCVCGIFFSSSSVYLNGNVDCIELNWIELNRLCICHEMFLRFSDFPLCSMSCEFYSLLRNDIIVLAKRVKECECDLYGVNDDDARETKKKLTNFSTHTKARARAYDTNERRSTKVVFMCFSPIPSVYMLFNQWKWMNFKWIWHTKWKRLNHNDSQYYCESSMSFA